MTQRTSGAILTQPRGSARVQELLSASEMSSERMNKSLSMVLKGISISMLWKCPRVGSSTSPKIPGPLKLELLYILIEIDNVTEIELDKLNFVYKVHGKDLLEKCPRVGSSTSPKIPGPLKVSVKLSKSGSVTSSEIPTSFAISRR